MSTLITFLLIILADLSHRLRVAMLREYLNHISIFITIS